ncbi:MAG: chromosome partitioning protein ParB [Actinomycetota bacterium]|nr:chromosome partitioning protein ParB [Actinomycetota bacterium]
MDTGFPDSDSRDDFSRARRRYVGGALAARLRGRGDLNVMLPFDEVVSALGYRGERSRGRQQVPLDAIVGSVDRLNGFDRRFRPASAVARDRFERISAAQRRGQDMPPIQVYRVGEAHFVRDGHHRVAVARALGRSDIAAFVTEILTQVGASTTLRISDLPLKSHQRLFAERVPLSAGMLSQLTLTDPWDYALLAEGVEAWGFRVMQERGEFLSRETVAATWFREQYAPGLALMREAGLLGGATDTEVYLRLSAERYRILHSQHWDEQVIETLRQAR